MTYNHHSVVHRSNESVQGAKSETNTHLRAKSYTSYTKMDPRARVNMPRSSHVTSQSSSPMAAAVHPVRRRRGVRRGREENAAAAVEIEELESEVMRQNSYNYFDQQHGAQLELNTSMGTDDGVAVQLDVDGAAHLSSRKRQRTLAEQLEDLRLQPSEGDKATGSGKVKSKGQLAAAACRQAWNRVFAAQMAAQQRRAAAAKAKAAALAMPRAPSLAIPASAAVDVDMGGGAAAPSGGGDADLEDAGDMEESVARDAQGLKVLGATPDVKGMFFNGTGPRQRPMERMFRHYVTMAAERSARSDGNVNPRGDELVLFQPGPTSLEFPYSLFTPEQIEDLRTRHNRSKKKRQAATGRSPLGLGATSTSASGSFDNAWRFQEIDSSDEADVSSSAEDSDMDLSGDGEAAGPQLAGALSHGEWFVEDEDNDENNEIDDDL